MPTNLPPDYYKAEEHFRKATTNQEKIAWLEEMLAIMPKHKGTDHLKSDLRRKISKLKAAATKKSAPGRQVSAFHIEKEGAGTVVVLGPANSGKSALVAALTNARPEVAPYPFSTWAPTPGMMQFENVQIQLIDTPPLEGEFIEPELFNLVRNADMALLVVDLQADDPIEQIEETLTLLAERRIIPRHLEDQHKGRLRIKSMPILGVVNKCDDEALDRDFEVLCELMEEESCPLIPISVTAERHFERLKEVIYDELKIMRVYSRPPGKEPNFEAPFVLKIGSSVEDFAGKVHQDFRENLKSAKVWGSGAFDGQMVSRDYVLQEGDIVELRI